MIIDVESWDRAVELAGELSAAPGAGGEPIHEWLEVRPFLGTAAVTMSGPRDVDDAPLRQLIPEVIGVLVRRGADFASAEDAVQEALVSALATLARRTRRATRRRWLVTPPGAGSST